MALIIGMKSLYYRNITSWLCQDKNEILLMRYIKLLDKFPFRINLTVHRDIANRRKLDISQLAQDLSQLKFEELPF
jgi:hypothetical protein